MKNEVKRGVRWGRRPVSLRWNSMAAIGWKVGQSIVSFASEEPWRAFMIFSVP